PRHGKDLADLAELGEPLGERLDVGPLDLEQDDGADHGDLRRVGENVARGARGGKGGGKTERREGGTAGRREDGRPDVPPSRRPVFPTYIANPTPREAPRYRAPSSSSAIAFPSPRSAGAGASRSGR